MGTLRAYMFFVNMVGAIFVLPALAAWFFPEAREDRSAAAAGGPKLAV